MRSFARKTLLTLACIGLSTPLLAQERAAKDGDEGGFEEPIERSGFIPASLQRCPARLEPVTAFIPAYPKRRQDSLTATERFWLSQRALRAAAAVRARCFPEAD